MAIFLTQAKRLSVLHARASVVNQVREAPKQTQSSLDRSGRELRPGPQLSGYFLIRNVFFLDMATVHLVNSAYESATF